MFDTLISKINLSVEIRIKTTSGSMKWLLTSHFDKCETLIRLVSFYIPLHQPHEKLMIKDIRNYSLSVGLAKNNFSLGTSFYLMLAWQYAHAGLVQKCENFTIFQGFHFSSCLIKKIAVFLVIINIGISWCFFLLFKNGLIKSFGCFLENYNLVNILRTPFINNSCRYIFWGIWFNNNLFFVVGMFFDLNLMISTSPVHSRVSFGYVPMFISLYILSLARICINPILEKPLKSVYFLLSNSFISRLFRITAVLIQAEYKIWIFLRKTFHQSNNKYLLQKPFKYCVHNLIAILI